jgi:hypothetical protein
MSSHPFTASEQDGPAVTAARAAMMADRQVDARLSTIVDDLFLPTQARLDDRTRAAIGGLLETTVATLERDLCAHAGRLLTLSGLPEAAARVTARDGAVLARLTRSGLLRDPAIMAEFVAQARIDLIDASLIANRRPGSAATLLPRLAESGDGVVRRRAIAYLVADSRRRTPAAERRAELPFELQQRMTWWIAAVLRERLDGSGGVEGDRALAEAAQRSVAAHEDAERVETSALHLAGAIDAHAGERAGLMLDTLREGRLALFVALLAHGLGVEAGEARAVVLDAEGDRLWLALRALALDRAAIARIGWTLCEGDRTRDVERLPDALDRVAPLSPAEAATAIAPLALQAEFRSAVRALARGGAA